jgi:hypothetical protein
MRKFLICILASVVLVAILLSACAAPVSTATYTLSVSVSPSGAGSVSPPGGKYESGLQVTLTATPASGYTFDYWDGATSGSSHTVTITMNSNKSTTAHFKPVKTLSAPTFTPTPTLIPTPTVNILPFTYTGKGNGKTPCFKMQDTGVQLVRFKLTYKTTWDGDITIRFRIANIPNLVNDVSLWRSTKTWSDFPDRVESGVIYECVFASQKITINDYYLSIEDAPSDGEWTITVSRIGFVTYSKVDVEFAVEYAGKWEGKKQDSSEIGLGNQILRWSGPLEVPIEYTVRKLDGGTGPMTLKVIYLGQIVTQKTVVDQNEVHAYWLGP